MVNKKRKPLKIVLTAVLILAALATAYFCYDFISKDINGTGEKSGIVSINIKNNATEYDVAQLLYTKEIIESDAIWSSWMNKHYPNFEYIAGEYEVEASMSYNEIAESLKKPVVTHREVKVTIPEGYNVFSIAATLEGNGICSADEFLNVCKNKDGYDYSFISEIPDDSKIAYPLEGFLFPATYDFEENMDPREVADEMLSAFADRISEDWRNYCKNNDMSLYELVTLASVVEKETLGEGVAEKISSVFLNRLEIGQKLQSDVTIDYGNKLRENGFNDDVVTSYNTYKCSKLPSGPICCPGIANIDAVVNHEDTDYYYFFSYNNGADFYFTDDYKDFQREWSKLGKTNTQ